MKEKKKKKNQVSQMSFFQLTDWLLVSLVCISKTIRQTWEYTVNKQVAIAVMVSFYDLYGFECRLSQKLQIFPFTLISV